MIFVFFIFILLMNMYFTVFYHVLISMKTKYRKSINLQQSNFIAKAVQIFFTNVCCLCSSMFLSKCVCICAICLTGTKRCRNNSYNLCALQRRRITKNMVVMVLEKPMKCACAAAANNMFRVFIEIFFNFVCNAFSLSHLLWCAQPTQPVTLDILGFRYYCDCSRYVELSIYWCVCV